MASENKQEQNNLVPEWLLVMFRSGFFRPCSLHGEEKKSDLNNFCIDCASPFCSGGLAEHQTHKRVQIRKYVYRDVVNVKDMKKFFNCSGIQRYTINGAKVILILPRPMGSRSQQNESNYTCINCGRILLEALQYCSLSCKACKLTGDGNEGANAPNEDAEPQDQPMNENPSVCPPNANTELSPPSLNANSPNENGESRDLLMNGGLARSPCKRKPKMACWSPPFEI